MSFWSDPIGSISGTVSDVFHGAMDVINGAVKGVGDLVQEVAKSPLGKALLIAAAIYFGGAALAGGFGEMAAGGEFLAGMGAGVESAAATLSGAWTAAVGGDLAGAAGMVGDAWSAAGASGEMASAAAQTASLGVSGTSAALEGGFGSGVPAATTATPAATAATATPAALDATATLGAEAGQAGVTAATPAANAATAATEAATTATGSAAPSTVGVNTAPGLQVPSNAGVSEYSLNYKPALDTASNASTSLGSNAVKPPPSWWASQDPFVKYGLIQSGMQVGGSLISGMGQASAAQQARDQALADQNAALARHNTNVGSLLQFAPTQPSYAPAPRRYVPPPPVGLASRYMPPARA